MRTARPLASLPVLQAVAVETRRGGSYRHEGRFRQGEGHCVFQYTLHGLGIFRDHQGEHAVPEAHGFLCRIADPRTAYYHPAARRAEDAMPPSDRAKTVATPPRAAPTASMTKAAWMGEGRRAPWSFVYINMRGPTVDAFVAEMTARHGAVLRLGRDHEALTRLLAWRGRPRGRCEVTAAAGASQVQSLLLALLETAEAERPEREGRAERGLVARALEEIEARVHEDLNASDLAGLLGISREHLTRIFRRETGQTPYQTILRKRMLAACRLLKETDLSAKAIAARLGYAEAGHFTRAFKRVMRLSPTRFRAVGSLPLD